MTQQVDKWDAEEWLQKNKDIWSHPMVTDRTNSNAYEVADLMAEFANYILSKQKQKQLIIDIMNEDAKDGLYKQQTAVEWLYTKLSTCTSEELVGNINKWFEQAKEIEKEQIINSHLTGLIHPLEMEATKQAEQYFNETYGGNK